MKKLVFLFLVFLTVIMLAIPVILGEGMGLELEGLARIEVAVEKLLP